MKYAPKGSLPAFIRQHVSTPHADSDPCVLWPFGTTHGYGAIKWQGDMRSAHTVLLELRDGPAPDSTMEACHGPCANPLCIVHVRWGTRSENINDRLRDGVHNRGERCGRSKLTKAQVIEIRRRSAGGESRVSVAADFPVRPEAIGKIVRGRRWLDA